MNPEELTQFNNLKEEVMDLRYILSRKTGLGSADIKGKIVNPSNVTATIGADSVKQSQLDYEQVSVTVTAGQPSGTATVTTGAIVIGYISTGNQDQFVDNISITSTTLTLTLSANATADNLFQITLLKA